MILKPFDPFPVLDTERLILKEISGESVNDLFDILSDPDVAAYDYFYPIETVESASLFIKKYHAELTSEEEITWGIFLKSSGKLIGTCCLGSFNQDALRAEVGYALLKREWNKGYGTEALGKITEFGFDQMKLNRIEAMITPGNDSSVRLLEKVGYKKEGLVRQRDMMKGKLIDSIIMGMLNEDLIRQN